MNKAREKLKTDFDLSDNDFRTQHYMPVKLTFGPLLSLVSKWQKTKYNLINFLKTVNHDKKYIIIIKTL